MKNIDTDYYVRRAAEAERLAANAADKCAAVRHREMAARYRALAERSEEPPELLIVSG